MLLGLLASAAGLLTGVLLGLVVQIAVFIETACQTDHLAKTIDYRKVAALGSRDDHMETIGPEIDCGNDLRRIGHVPESPRGAVDRAGFGPAGVRRRRKNRNRRSSSHSDFE